MSAFLSVAYDDRVELVVDGACCLPSGLLIAAVDKIVTSPHVPMAITGRGRHIDLQRIAAKIIDLSACGSVDATLDMLVESLVSLAAEPGDVPQHLEMAIAAISERDGPSSFYFASFPQDAIPALTLWKWDRGAPSGGGPIVPEDQLRDAGLTADAFADGIAAPGLKLLQLARAIPDSDPTNPDGRHAYWIGAHVDHAVVTKDGVSVNRIHEWPDHLLQPIRPVEANA